MNDLIIGSLAVIGGLTCGAMTWFVIDAAQKLIKLFRKGLPE